MAKIKRINLPLSKADGYAKSEDDILKEVLKKHNLNNSNYLFTVVDGKRADNLEKTGTYRAGDTIDAFTITEFVIKNDRGSGPETAGYYLDHYIDKPAICVYKTDCFVKEDEEKAESMYEYRFINPTSKPDALEAIIKVT